MANTITITMDRDQAELLVKTATCLMDGLQPVTTGTVTNWCGSIGKTLIQFSDHDADAVSRGALALRSGLNAPVPYSGAAKVAERWQGDHANLDVAPLAIHTDPGPSYLAEG